MAQPVTGTIDLATAMNNPRDAYANLLRSQHEEWVKDFQPLEQNLIGMTTYNGNKGIADGIIANQSAAINNNFEQAQGVASRSLARYGVAMNPAETQVSGRAIDLAKTTAQVDMRNKVNNMQADLNRSILNGGTAVGG